MNGHTKILKLKLLGAFILFTLVPMLCIAIYSYHNIKNEITTSTLLHLEAIAKMKSLQIERFYERTTSYIRTIQSSPYVKNMPETKEEKAIFQEYLKQYIANSNMDEIYILSKEGKILASSTKRGIHAIVVENKTAFEKGKENIYFSDIYRGHEQNKNYLFTVSAPIMKDKELIGVVMAEFVADDFFEQIQDYSGLGQSGETLLAKNVGGDIVFLNPLRNDSNTAEKRTISINGELAKPAIYGASGKIGSGRSIDYRGVSVFAAWRHIPVTGWGMVAKIDTNEALQPLETVRISIVVTAMVLLFFGAVVSMRVVINLTNPVELLEVAAHTDILTGLPNRELLMELLERIISKAKLNNATVAVMFLDLDGFKSVNDTYGHEAGDLLLKHVADRLNRVIRQSDTVARLGGDEFVVVLCGIKEIDNITKIAKQIVDSLCAEFEINGAIVNIGVSIGISVFPQNAATAEGMLKRADEAMYEVKKFGKNSFRFADSSSNLPA